MNPIILTATLLIAMLPFQAEAQNSTEFSGDSKAGSPSDSSAIHVVERFVAAYNRHEPDAMLEWADPTIRWLSVRGSKMFVEADGAEALREAMEGYFRNVPSARSTIESMTVNGAFVSVLERAHWTSNGEERSQSAIAVYEVAGGQVLSVWYFPAQ